MFKHLGCSTDRQPILRTSHRTIYTAGRPPWYDYQGNGHLTPNKEHQTLTPNKKRYTLNTQQRTLMKHNNIQNLKYETCKYVKMQNIKKLT
jgi:hypothetical protein